MKIIITESQYKNLILESDYYNPETLYYREKIVNALQRGPRYIREYAKKLPHLDCPDGSKKCTRIPQTVWEYIFGRF